MPRQSVSTRSLDVSPQSFDHLTNSVEFAMSFDKQRIASRDAIPRNLTVYRERLRLPCRQQARARQGIDLARVAISDQRCSHIRGRQGTADNQYVARR